MGTIPGLKAFIAAVVGGIGSIPGAMLGGMLLGMSEILFVTFFPAISGYRDSFVFIILILILFLKPDGILGTKTQEKV
jgi:branched-chain amino acid transport system permease protein